MKKKIGLGIVIALLGLGIWQRELVSYGYMQAKGQLHIMWNTRPVTEVLADSAYPDSLKAQLRLIGEIKQFAVDSLGLNPSKNYTTFYDQRRQPLLWVLTGAERYKLVPVEYHFPFLGTFSYKGFFDHTRLVEADSALQRAGYDTRISEVSAYSTLGFFKDPILSSMLERPTGSLAELIIHELTHGTLFIKDNLEYNENLADFVGEYGAARFMAHKFGPNSAAYRKHLVQKAFFERYDDHILHGTHLLDSLYNSFTPRTPVAQKEQLKWQFIGQIVSSIDTLRGTEMGPTIKKRRVGKRNLPNNAYFIGYLTYRKQQNQFRTEFDRKFNGNFSRYLTYLKQTYPSL